MIPFYIPLLALICGLLLIKSEKMYFKKNMIYAYGFIIILFTELSVRYTGFNIFISLAFILTPIILFATLYFFIMFKFSNELNR